jgi:hypothetical protein
MNKINGFPPENPDWGCAVYCGTTPQCFVYCNAYCEIGHPMAYFDTFNEGASSVVGASYWIVKVDHE